MRYAPLELGQAGNDPCPDAFNEDSTAIVPDCQRVILQISGQAVFIQFGIMPQGRSQSEGSVVWQVQEPYLPMIAALSRAYDALRVRNYTPGKESQVLVTFL